MAATLKLAGIDLDLSMQFAELYQSQRVAQTALPTLGGGIAVFADVIQTGQEITLVSGTDFGLLGRDTVEQLKELADVPLAVYVLEMNGVTQQVIFRHNDNPAFAAEPLLPRMEPMVDDLFRCQIKLLTV